MAENGVPKGDGRTQGPPKGSPMDSPWTGAPIPQGDSTKRPIPADEVRQRIERITGSTNNSLTRNDPGFQNPSDALDAGTRARSSTATFRSSRFRTRGPSPRFGPRSGRT